MTNVAAEFIDPSHPEGVCQRCGEANVCWYAPSDVWNAVMRGGDRGAPDTYGIVCPTCFAGIATAAGVGSVWVLTPEGERDV